MEVTINYLAIFVAGIVQMVLGFLWYGPLFGKPWAKMMGFTKEDEVRAKKEGMGKTYGMTFAATLLIAYVLTHFIQYGAYGMGISGIGAGIQTAFWAWLGFIMPVQLNSMLFGNKPKNYKLFAIDTCYYLVSLLVMGVVLTSLV